MLAATGTLLHSFDPHLSMYPFAGTQPTSPETARPGGHELAAVDLR